MLSPPNLFQATQPVFNQFRGALPRTKNDLLTPVIEKESIQIHTSRLMKLLTNTAHIAAHISISMHS